MNIIPIQVGDITLQCPSEILGMIVKVIKGEEYHLLDWQTNMPPTVVWDVGANVGAFTTYIHLNFPNAQIYAFEPQIQLYNLMLTSFNTISNIKIFPFGLWFENAVIDLYTKKNFPYVGNSIYKGSDVNIRDINKVSVQKASAVAKDLGISNIDLLKVDTEGCEAEIIGDLVGSQIRLGTIYIEYHSEEFRREIDATLKTHLLVSCIAGPHLGQLIYVNNDITESLGYDYLDIRHSQHT